MIRRVSVHRFFVVTLIVLFVSCALSLKVGVFKDMPFDLLLELRVPRLILALCVGAGLAVSGVILQSVFSNPLCEPYTIGVSSGAALGAVIGISLSSMLKGQVMISAFLGALLVVGWLKRISKKNTIDQTQLLLMGVMIQFFCSSLVALWMVLADSSGLQSAIFWLMGDLSRATLLSSCFIFVSIFLIIFGISKKSMILDAFLIGEEGAQSLGVDVYKQRGKLLGLSSILVALCVSASGQIGFVGLLVPHLMRQLVGPLHKRLILFSALWGGIMLVLSDLIARGLIHSYEFPVAVVTALIGAPLFAILIGKEQWNKTRRL